MSDKQRALAWAGGAAAVLICTVAGVLLFKAGLDDADKWSSIIGMSVTVLIGLPLSLYQLLLARRALTFGTSTGGAHITAGGNRSIAAQTIGSASTGDGSPLASPAPHPCLDSWPAPRPENAASDPSAGMRIQTAGERSIAGQNIGSATTGDTSPIQERSGD